MTKATLDVYLFALQNYKRDTGEYPSSDEGLNALIVKPYNISNWKGPYLNYLFIIKDWWHNEYKYIKTSEDKFELYSFGQNKIDEFGNGDDLNAIR